LIAKPGRLPVIDLGSDHDRIGLPFSHFNQSKAKSLGQQCARDLDQSQVGKVVDNSPAIRVKKHDSRLGLNAWRKSAHLAS
jgi:hypothetical protein